MVIIHPYFDVNYIKVFLNAKLSLVAKKIDLGEIRVQLLFPKRFEKFHKEKLK